MPPDEEGAGLGEGTEAVLKGLSKPELYRSAILGALANLIEVEKQFVPAIEAALGQQLRTVFIHDATFAEAMALEYDCPPQRFQMIQQKASETLERVAGWDREPESYLFGFDTDQTGP